MAQPYPTKAKSMTALVPDSVRFTALIALVFSFAASSALNAANFYVSTDGDDANPGTASHPFRTVSEGALALAPGDCLFVYPGVYRDEGDIFLRFVGPAPSFEFLPIVGSPNAITRIIGIKHRGKKPIIQGNLDIRGAYIRVSGLVLRGDRAKLEPGIGIYESHNVTIKNCSVYNHGGGGIAFAQCDLVCALNNWVGFNAYTNPNQSSGISLYQSVKRTESDRYYGAVIAGNICVGNENKVPPIEGGTITDGNGIIADDFLYTQDTGIVQEAMLGTVDPGLATGVPVIEFDEDGAPLSYSRHTLIKRNTTLFNGGRGIHSFLADNIHIVSNLSYFNLKSSELTDGLPRDAVTNDPFFVYGEINLTDSQNCWVSGNVGVTDEMDAAGGAEQFFERGPEGTDSSNWWNCNWFRSKKDAERDVDVLGVIWSSLFRQGR